MLTSAYCCHFSDDLIYTDPLGVHIVGAAHGQGTMDCKRMIDMIREKSPMDKIIMENEIAFLSKDEMIADFEVIRLVKATLTPFEVNEETLCLDDIKEQAHTGSFVACDYTLDYFMDLYMPHTGGRGAKTKSPTYYEDSIQEEIERLMDEFEDNRPKLDANTKARVRTVLLKSGLSADILDRIEAM